MIFDKVRLEFMIPGKPPEKKYGKYIKRPYSRKINITFFFIDKLILN